MYVCLYVCMSMCMYSTFICVYVIIVYEYIITHCTILYLSKYIMESCTAMAKLAIGLRLNCRTQQWSQPVNVKDQESPMTMEVQDENRFWKVARDH